MRTPKTIGSAVFLCLSLLHPSPVSSGRPLVVDDARTVDVEDVQFELGIVQGQPEHGGREQAWPAMALTYGLYKNLEVGLGIQRIDSDPKGEPPARGFEDLHIAAKYDFLPGEKYDFAFSFDLKVPTANRHKGLSSGRFDENFLLIATKHFFPAALDLNFGYLVVDSPPGEKLKDRFFGGVALRYGLNQQWRVVSEIYGLSREASGAKNEANFQVGIRYHSDLPLVLDAAIGRSLLKSGTRIQGTLGVTWTHKPDL
jgi:outer membrane putative beta-barrel porin/alpha-amylase